MLTELLGSQFYRNDNKIVVEISVSNSRIVNNGSSIEDISSIEMKRKPCTFFNSHFILVHWQENDRER